MSWLNKIRALVLAATLSLTTGASALTVYDPWNHIENINQLAQQVEQVAHLVEMVKSGRIIQEIAEMNNLGWVIDMVETYQKTVGALDNLQSALNGLYQSANASSASLEEIAKMYLNSPVQTWDEYVERENRIAEANNGVHTAAFQHATETLKGLEQQHKTIQELGAKADTATGSKQLMQLLNKHMGLIASQNAQLVAATSQKNAAEADEKMQEAKRAAEQSKVVHEAISKQAEGNMKRLTDAVAPGGEFVNKLAGMPLLLAESAKSVAEKLKASANHLLLAFTAITLCWIGIEMMMGAKPGDNIYIGEAIKLLLLFGLAKGVLDNHSYLYSVLTESVDHLCKAMGAAFNLHDFIPTFFERFVTDPIKSLSESQSHIIPYGKNETPGFFAGLKAIFTSPITYVGNVITHFFLVMFTIPFIAVGGIMALLGVFTVMMAETMFGLVAAIGVICVPFLVLPKLNKIFWSWFDGLVYAMALKITVSGIIAMTSSLHTVATKFFVLSAEGAIEIQWGAVMLYPTVTALMLILLRYAFTIAGMIAGTRLSIDPLGGAMSAGATAAKWAAGKITGGGGAPAGSGGGGAPTPSSGYSFAGGASSAGGKSSSGGGRPPAPKASASPGGGGAPAPSSGYSFVKAPPSQPAGKK